MRTPWCGRCEEGVFLSVSCTVSEWCCECVRPARPSPCTGPRQDEAQARPAQRQVRKEMRKPLCISFPAHTTCHTLVTSFPCPHHHLSHSCHLPPLCTPLLVTPPSHLTLLCIPPLVAPPCHLTPFCIPSTTTCHSTLSSPSPVHTTTRRLTVALEGGCVLISPRSIAAT